MLNLEDDLGRTHEFIVVDIHHHIGSEGQTRNLNPKEPNGSYDYFRGVLFGSEFKAGLSTLLRDTDEHKFHRCTGEICIPHPTLVGLQRVDKRLERAFKGTWAIDLSVAFPMHDDFRAKDGVEYRASNRRMGKVSRVIPNSLRFIPWGRINPSEGRAAVEELARAFEEDGIRGLKLHPKSDGFDLEGPQFREVLRTAARSGIPVILHTDWKSDRRRIKEAVDDVLVELADEGDSRAIGGMCVILGHYGWGADAEMIGFIAHPCVYGEVSGLHGRGTIEFFCIARESYHAHEWDMGAILSRTSNPELLREALEPRMETDWSKKVMFGSDIPFLNQNNSIDVISTLLNRELDLTSREVANILGLNAIRLLSGAPGSHGRSPVRSEAPRSRSRFTGSLQEGEAFISAVLGGLPSGVRSIGFAPVITAMPHVRLLPELGLLTFTDSEGRCVTLRSVQFIGLDRAMYIPHEGDGRGPWILPRPLSQELADALGAVDPAPPSTGIEDLANELVISSFNDLAVEQAKEV